MVWWTNKQVAFLVKRWEAGDSYEQIADAMAEQGWPVRSRQAITAKRKHLGLSGRKIVAKPKPVTRPKSEIEWPTDRVAALEQALRQCKSRRVIARDLGLTVGAVAGKVWRMKRAEASAHAA